MIPDAKHVVEVVGLFGKTEQVEQNGPEAPVVVVEVDVSRVVKFVAVYAAVVIVAGIVADTDNQVEFCILIDSHPARVESFDIHLDCKTFLLIAVWLKGK